MVYKLRYFDEVITDINEAKQWYKNQRAGLEEDFSKAIEYTILKILERPLTYSKRYRNIRIAHPPIFPYNIHFYIDKLKSCGCYHCNYS